MAFLWELGHTRLRPPQRERALEVLRAGFAGLERIDKLRWPGLEGSVG